MLPLRPSEGVYSLATADELLGVPYQRLFPKPFQPGCILVPLATWFLKELNRVSYKRNG